MDENARFAFVSTAVLGAGLVVLSLWAAARRGNFRPDRALKTVGGFALSLVAIGLLLLSRTGALLGLPLVLVLIGIYVVRSPAGSPVVGYLPRWVGWLLLFVGGNGILIGFIRLATGA